jgi:hypothetical protein
MLLEPRPSVATRFTEIEYLLDLNPAKPTTDTAAAQSACLSCVRRPDCASRSGTAAGFGTRGTRSRVRKGGPTVWQTSCLF